MARKQKDPTIEVVGFESQTAFDSALAQWEAANASNPFLQEAAERAGGKISSEILLRDSATIVRRWLDRNGLGFWLALLDYPDREETVLIDAANEVEARAIIARDYPDATVANLFVPTLADLGEA